jgi:hypothetical protein
MVSQTARLPGRIPGILVSRFGPVLGVPTNRRPLAERSKPWMSGDDIPACGDQVAYLIKIVAKGKSDLEEDQDRLQRLFGALLGVETGDVGGKITTGNRAFGNCEVVQGEA